MQTLLLVAALGLAQAPSTQAPTPAPAQAAAPATATPKPPPAPDPLAFFSESFPFGWDRVIPLTINLDGLKVNSIFFNRRLVQPGFFDLFKGAEFGTRAQVEVTNTSKHPKIPGFAVAVLDKEGRLIGVASGGAKVGTISPGTTETFDLNFTQVKERLAFGEKFLLTIELRN